MAPSAMCAPIYLYVGFLILPLQSFRVEGVRKYDRLHSGKYEYDKWMRDE